jgi:cathepsin H
LPSHAFEYIRYNGGLNSEVDYPYLAEDTGSCRFDNQRVVAYAPGGSINITAYDEDELT